MIRCQGPHKVRLSAKSWNRAVAALDYFYKWAKAQKLVAELPFRYGARTAWKGSGGQPEAPPGTAPSGARNTALEGTSERKIVHMSMDEYQFFATSACVGACLTGDPIRPSRESSERS